jgi:N-acetylmuramoyl-L-alanine amidase
MKHAKKLNEFNVATGRIVTLLVVVCLLSACVGAGSATRIPSVNQNSRVNIVVIHHTTANFEDSVAILTKASSRPVSSHYLIPEPSDPTYTHRKLRVFALVPESQRAWHAGHSYWAGKTGLNDQSIGIELVNQTYCHQNRFSGDETTDTGEPTRLCFYPDFAESQIDILVELLHGILERHPDIKATNIIGHADIAPSRKIDPGPRFPWQRLYQVGIGAWFDDTTVIRYWEQFVTTPLPLQNVQRALRAYGYDVEATGETDTQTHDALRAFQMHFRPFAVTGDPSPASDAILFALIEKYFPRELESLLTVESPEETASELTDEAAVTPAIVMP